MFYYIPSWYILSTRLIFPFMLATLAESVLCVPVINYDNPMVKAVASELERGKPSLSCAEGLVVHKAELFTKKGMIK